MSSFKFTPVSLTTMVIVLAAFVLISVQMQSVLGRDRALRSLSESTVSRPMHKFEEEIAPAVIDDDYEYEDKAKEVLAIPFEIESIILNSLLEAFKEIENGSTEEDAAIKFIELSNVEGDLDDEFFKNAPVLMRMSAVVLATNKNITVPDTMPTKNIISALRSKYNGNSNVAPSMLTES